MFKVDRFRPADCSQVAELHVTCLRTPFGGRAGLELLTRYYRIVALEAGACGYLVRHQDRILGFVCGIWQPNALRQLLLRSQWAGLVWWGIWQGLARPSLVADLIGRLIGSPDKALSPGYELRPIVVAPQARRMGIARLLLNALLEDARQRGFDRIFLFTEEDNLAAQAFYGSTGFYLVGRTTKSGVRYLRYERPVEPSVI